MTPFQALDLCLRDRQRIKDEKHYDESPSVQYSPVSNSSDSDSVLVNRHTFPAMWPADYGRQLLHIARYPAAALEKPESAGRAPLPPPLVPNPFRLQPGLSISVEDSNSCPIDRDSESVSPPPPQPAGFSPKMRLARPFKAYAKDPLRLGLPIKDAAFEEFRQMALSQVKATTGTNKNMRRTSQSALEKSSDPDYMEKRRKNNEAAKRSRDARRQREDELAIRVAFLEREIMRMDFQNSAQLAEIKKLRQIIAYKQLNANVQIDL